ncbi:MAG: MFS transporter, partial [Pirellulales bacterium]
VYFPTLFPTHLRATGSGFCFNTGRILAAPVLIWLSAWMKATFDLRLAVTCLGGMFLFGLVFLLFLPETKGKDLPR